MKRVPVLLLLLLCSVTLTVARGIYPWAEVGVSNKGDRECKGSKETPTSFNHLAMLGLHRTMAASELSAQVNDAIKVDSTTRFTPRATVDPKIAELKPTTPDSVLELPYKFPDLLLERSRASTHALSMTSGDEGANKGRVDEDTRTLRVSHFTRVLLPFLFSFKLQLTAMAIFLVLIAIKKLLIVAAFLIPIVSNTKLDGHYIADLKFPRTHEQEHVFVHHVREGQMRRPPPYAMQPGQWGERNVPQMKGSSHYDLVPPLIGPQVYRTGVITDQGGSTGYNQPRLVK